MKPPKWLDSIGKAYWRKVAPTLTRDGILNPVTEELLATAAQAYSVYRHALTMLESEGRVITAATGAVKVNPWCVVEKQAFEAMARVYKELNLSVPTVPTDDLDEFIVCE